MAAQTYDSGTARGGWKRRRHRLYWRIWFAISASVVLFAVLAALLWHFFLSPFNTGPVGETLAATIAEELRTEGTTPDGARDVLERWRRRAWLDLALFDRDGRRLVQVGGRVPRPMPQVEEHHYLWRHPRERRSEHSRDDADSFREGTRAAFAYRLGDDAWLVIARDFRRVRPPLGPISSLALLALAIGLGTFPVVRRLTRRLERLQEGVNRLGSGDLAARVAIEGRDEVAQLAASFNDAATRIEQLVASHRSLLANASHELRSPLARVRMAVELLKTDARPDLKEELQRNIAELDALIDEILLASRLDAANDTAALQAQFEDVDLTAIVAEESAHAGAEFDGVPVTLHGDARLLRRLVRNLLENARRYGGAAPIDVALAIEGGQAVLDVRDRGPGVAAEERERIFEPFYRARGAAESAGGVGLGLALVRKIAEQHGGQAACLPRAGGGTVFRVTLAVIRAP